MQLNVFPPSQTSSGVETASFECSASVAKVRPLKTSHVFASLTALVVASLSKQPNEATEEN